MVEFDRPDFDLAKSGERFGRQDARGPHRYERGGSAAGISATHTPTAEGGHTDGRRDWAICGGSPRGGAVMKDDDLRQKIHELVQAMPDWAVEIWISAGDRLLSGMPPVEVERLLKKEYRAGLAEHQTNSPVAR